MYILRACAIAALLWTGLLILLNVVGLAAVPPAFVALAFALPLAAPTALAILYDVFLAARRYVRERREAQMEWDPA